MVKFLFTTGTVTTHSWIHSALYTAANRTRPDVQEKLQVNVQDEGGFTPLHFAAYQAFSAGISSFSDLFHSYTVPTLPRSCSRSAGRLDHLRICEYLVKQQQDPVNLSLVDADLHSPLHYIARVNPESKGTGAVALLESHRRCRRRVPCIV